MVRAKRVRSFLPNLNSFWKIRPTRLSLILVVFFLGCQTHSQQDDATERHSAFDETWPSTEQTALVAQRMKSFPRETLVSSVDWYEPLALVEGNSTNSFPEAKNNFDKWSAAIKIAERHKSHALLIWQGDDFLLEKYWPGFDAASLYDTASMHKAVLAVLVGVAVDRGLIDSIDDPLSKYLPELATGERGNIPLRSLLEMSSGISNPPVSNEPAGAMWQTYLGDDLWQAMLRWPVTNQPYTEFYYANANPQYLGWVLDRVTGSYRQFLSDALWKPLAATDARVWLENESGIARTSCCLQASARDWLRFGQLLLNKGRLNETQIVSSDWIENMIAPSRLNPNFGWQIWRGHPHLPERAYNKDTPFVVPAAKPFIAKDTVFLDGSGGQRVYIIPSKNMVIVRIGTPARDWDDSELPNTVLETLFNN